MFYACLRGMYQVVRNFWSGAELPSVLRPALNSVDLCLASPSLYCACYHETGSSLYTVEVTTGGLITPDSQTFFQNF